MTLDTATHPTVTIRSGSNGYSADQVADRAITIERLLEQLEELRDQYGSDARVVICTSGRGATYEPALEVNDLDNDDESDW